MTVAFETPHAMVHLGDALTVLRELPSESVHMIVTSPPFFALRDYGVSGQIGMEATPQAWRDALVAVFREARRVLRDDGTLWVECGDSYVSAPKGPGGDDKSTLTPSGVRYQRSATPGPGRVGSNAKHGQERGDFGATPNRRGRLGDIKPKDLIGQAWLLAFGLRADGWWLRQEIIWHKPDAFPESVRDRPTRAHSTLFLLSKKRTYFFDADAISEPVSENTNARVAAGWKKPGGWAENGKHDALSWSAARGRSDNGKTIKPGKGQRNNDSFAIATADRVTHRNARSVWSIQTAGYSGAHFAVFPEELAERCILAGTSAVGVCPECGKPWVRETAKTYDNPGNRRTNGAKQQGRREEGIASMASGQRLEKRIETTGWKPTCGHRIPGGARPRTPVPATVLDPFLGSGTSAQVAVRLGRRAVGIELNPAYLPLIERRIAQGEMERSRGEDGPLVATPVTDMGPLWTQEPIEVPTTERRGPVSASRERERDEQAGRRG